jgi:phosphoserine aminotransferase
MKAWLGLKKLKSYKVMTKTYNFNAGPAALPKDVLSIVQSELLNWHGTDCSILEVGHRSEKFSALIGDTKSKLKQLLSISDEYEILFMHGGASAQFFAIPMNFLGNKSSVNYLNSGAWSKKAIGEAKRYANVNDISVVSENLPYAILPQSEWQHDKDAAYLHYTDNETISGVEFSYTPQVDLPLICDMSSNVLSKPIDVSRYSMIYAGLQKNLGPAGMALVIVRKNDLQQALPITPAIYDYQTQIAQNSLYNTPNVFCIYVLSLMIDHLLKRGGLEAVALCNQRKANMLYQLIDESSLYENKVAEDSRSLMNITFNLPTPELESRFLASANEAGLMNLKGHRSMGGIRASIYNAMTEEGVLELCQFMKRFMIEND